MEQIDYELLNKRLEHFLFDGFPVFEEDFAFEERLCNIILFNGLSYDCRETKEEIYKTKNKISYDKVISYNLEFFRSIDFKYYEKLHELLDKLLISFEKTDDLDANSNINLITDEFKVMLLNTPKDVLCLGHEFMHYLNSRGEIDNNITSYYTEALSAYCEFLLVDFLIKKYPRYEKDLLKMKRNTYISLYEQNICTKIIIELLKKKNNGIIINTYEMTDIVANLYSFNIDIEIIDSALNELLEFIFDQDEEMLEDAYIISNRDTIALTLACYMYENYQNKEKQIFELGDYLHNMKLKDVLLFLDLEPKPDCSFDLTEESYDKIEKSYKKCLKNLW